MSLLNIEDVTIRVGGRTLLDRASLALDPGRTVGLVGRNGAGKSTLLRAIAGEVGVDGGSIRLSSRARVAWVRQEAPEGPQSLLDTVLAADEERTALLAAAEDHTRTDLAEVHERLRAIEADSAPARAATILSGLGFDAAAQARAVSSFSGGWRMRVALAGPLFLMPDLLLLDEPTNHLDLEAAMWLEGWLSRFPGAALIVSHERGLLDRAVTGIAHLDHSKIALYPGGFEAFVRVRTERAEHQNKAADKIAAQRAHLQAFVDRFRAKATKARQAQARVKAIEKLPTIESVIEDSPTKFDFPEPPKMAPPILSMQKVSVGYGDAAPILTNLSLSLDPEDRVALLGANGNGKSTLAKLIAGRLEASSGDLRRGPKLRVGYFAQHQTDELDFARSPIDHMQEALPRATAVQVRAQLARFGLDADRANTLCGELSGGEKARLLLALATREAPQLLILDEPTNHLDIDARDALVRALGNFGGAVLLITHDPDLVSMVADRLWLVADGTVKPYDGDLDDYRVWLSERAKVLRAESNPRKKGDKPKATTAPLKKAAREAEIALAKIAADQAATEAKLADPKIYGPGRSHDVIAAKLRLAQLKRDAQAAEDAWLAAEAALEQAHAA